MKTTNSNDSCEDDDDMRLAMKWAWLIIIAFVLTYYYPSKGGY
jgi:hypothetical protein